jgi:hypothetical protein
MNTPTPQPITAWLEKLGLGQVDPSGGRVEVSV